MNSIQKAEELHILFTSQSFNSKISFDKDNVDVDFLKSFNLLCNNKKDIKKSKSNSSVLAV